jgi:hypothetical protein
LRGLLSKQDGNEAKLEKLEPMIAEMKQAASLPKKTALKVVAYKFAQFVVLTASQTFLADGLHEIVKQLHL